MVNGLLNFGATARDLPLQRCYPLLQLVDGQMIDVLPGELLHRVVGALREKIVRLHILNVDPDGAHVNKPFARYQCLGVDWG